MPNYAYLVMVNADNNNNKFYEIKEQANGSLDVTYGRVGGTNAVHKHYERWERDFYSLKNSKEAKGYSDVTALHSQKQNVADVTIDGEKLGSYKDISDEDTKELMDLLVTESRNFMKSNYTIAAAEITRKMVEEAESDIADLVAIASQKSYDAVRRFNDTLQTLFTDIPRKMSKVKDSLAQSPDDFAEIIQREQDMLDNIKGQLVKTVPQNDGKNKKDITLLEANGLKVRPVTFAEEDQITAHLGDDYYGRSVERRYVKAYAVENNKTRKAYEQFKSDHHIRNRDVKLFYHGSKVENWYSIMKTGLSLNPNASITGKMFGNGIYFASECRKSLNYMDTKHSRWNNGQRNSGYTAVYAVALGKCFEPTRSGNYSKRNLPDGCLSVYADKNKTGLQNDEYIIYDEAQCTIKYLIEFTHPNVRELSFNLKRSDIRNEIALGMDTMTSLGDGKIEVELDLTVVSDKARNEMKRVLGDCDKLVIEYVPDRDKGKITVLSEDGTNLSDNLTNDDKGFLMREMKKAFCESETEWKDVVALARETKKNKVIDFKPKSQTEIVKE